MGELQAHAQQPSRLVPRLAEQAWPLEGTLAADHYSV
jgi:hypothetical protein